MKCARGVMPFILTNDCKSADLIMRNQGYLSNVEVNPTPMLPSVSLPLRRCAIILKWIEIYYQRRSAMLARSASQNPQ